MDPSTANKPSYQSWQFGKNPAKHDKRTLLFQNYLMADGNALPPPPISLNLLTRIYENLVMADPAALFPMDGNDVRSDCTIAALAHAITTYNGLVGTENIMPEAEVIKLYLTMTGGLNSGLNMLDVLNYWRQHTVSDDNILAFVSIEPKNHTHVAQAVQLFGGVYLGFQVQQNCVQDFNAGRPWSPGPLTNEGHAVFVAEYGPEGVTVLTWGKTQQATWAWWDQCVDEAYAILPENAENINFVGFDIEQLKIDLSVVAN